MKKCWFKQPEITVEPEKNGNCTKWTRNVRLKLGSQAMKLHHELMGRSVSAFWILWDVVVYTDAILKCLSHPGLVCENPRESHVPFHQFWDSSKSKEISGYPPGLLFFEVFTTIHPNNRGLLKPYRCGLPLEDTLKVDLHDGSFQINRRPQKNSHSVALGQLS
jgi:hypothetical protein